jgi:hypothetical protein
MENKLEKADFTENVVTIFLKIRQGGKNSFIVKNV